MRGEVLTPAKLNWDLRVLGRRPDGFHELRSWFLAVDWHDRLRAGPQRDGEAALMISGPEAAGVPHDRTNLVLRAERAWRETFPDRAARIPPLRWVLHKEISHGAGLGGGSGNAAGVLALLERFAGEDGANPTRLYALAVALGSDLPFFLEYAGGMELRGGRGEVRIASAPVPAPWLLIAVPRERLATAAVYAAAAAPPFVADPGPSTMSPGVQPGPNELAAAAQRVEPGLGAWRAAVAEFVPMTMSGSGSAHFAAFAQEAMAWSAAGALAPLCQRVRLTKACQGPALRIRME